TESATLRGFLQHPSGFSGAEFAYGFVKAPLPNLTDVPDFLSTGYEEPVSFPLVLDSSVALNLVTAPSSGELIYENGHLVYVPDHGVSGADGFLLEFLHQPTGLYLLSGTDIEVGARPNTAPVLEPIDPLTVDEDSIVLLPVTLSNEEDDVLQTSYSVDPST